MHHNAVHVRYLIKVESNLPNMKKHSTFIIHISFIFSQKKRIRTNLIKFLSINYIDIFNTIKIVENGRNIFTFFYNFGKKIWDIFTFFL